MHENLCHRGSPSVSCSLLGTVYRNACDVEILFSFHEHLFSDFIDENYSLSFGQPLYFWNLTRRRQRTTREAIGWIKNRITIYCRFFRLNDTTSRILIIFHSIWNQKFWRGAHDCITWISQNSATCRYKMFASLMVSNTVMEFQVAGLIKTCTDNSLYYKKKQVFQQYFDVEAYHT